MVLLVVWISIAIYLTMLLTTGLLAWFYHKKQKAFLAYKSNFFSRIKAIAEQFDPQSIQPMNVNIELPKGELIYEIDELQIVISQNKKDKKELTRITKKNNYLEGIDESTDIPWFILKSSYQLTSSSIKSINYIGMAYVTNKRLLLTGPNGKMQIIWNKVLKVSPTIITLDKNVYTDGFIIKTQDELYEVITNNLTLPLIIDYLLKGGHNDK